MHKTRAHQISAAVVVASVGLGTAAASGSAPAAKTHVVKAQHVLFTPARLVIRHGDRVRWEFRDAGLRIKHTVTSTGPHRFRDMPTERLTGSFTARFTKAGVYRYLCTNHEATMTAVIIVR